MTRPMIPGIANEPRVTVSQVFSEFVSQRVDLVYNRSVLRLFHPLPPPPPGCSTKSMRHSFGIDRRMAIIKAMQLKDKERLTSRTMEIKEEERKGSLKCPLVYSRVSGRASPFLIPEGGRRGNPRSSPRLVENPSRTNDESIDYYNPRGDASTPWKYFPGQ